MTNAHTLYKTKSIEICWSITTSISSSSLKQFEPLNTIQVIYTRAHTLKSFSMFIRSKYSFFSFLLFSLLHRIITVFVVGFLLFQIDSHMMIDESKSTLIVVVNYIALHYKIVYNVILLNKYQTQWQNLFHCYCQICICICWAIHVFQVYMHIHYNMHVHVWRGKKCFNWIAFIEMTPPTVHIFVYIKMKRNQMTTTKPKQK